MGLRIPYGDSKKLSLLPAKSARFIALSPRPPAIHDLADKILKGRLPGGTLLKVSRYNKRLTTVWLGILPPQPPLLRRQDFPKFKLAQEIATCGEPPSRAFRGCIGELPTVNLITVHPANGASSASVEDIVAYKTSTNRFMTSYSST